jgi:hypothetical protein
MLREVLKGTGVLVALYLVLNKATAGGQLLTSGETAGKGILQTLQGR